MKNATIEDVKYMKTNTMYLVEHKWFGPFRGHIKQPMLDLNDGWTDPWLVETAEGSLLVVERSWIKAVPRKQGTPPKQRRQPKKGIKPEPGNAVAYDAKLIAPGVKVRTKVLCRDGNIRTVKGLSDEGDIVNFTDGECVWLFNGRGNKYEEVTNPWDIMKIIIDQPKQDKRGNYTKGVWHFWDGKSSKPPVGGDVNVWFRFYDEENIGQMAAKAENLRWHWVGNDCDIIAFRIV